MNCEEETKQKKRVKELLKSLLRPLVLPLQVGILPLQRFPAPPSKVLRPLTLTSIKNSLVC